MRLTTVQRVNTINETLFECQWFEFVTVIQRCNLEKSFRRIVHIRITMHQLIGLIVTTFEVYSVFAPHDSFASHDITYANKYSLL